MDTIEKALQKKAAKSAHSNELLNKQKATELLDTIADQSFVQEVEQDTAAQETVHETLIESQQHSYENAARQPASEVKQSKTINIDLNKLENLGFLSPHTANKLLHEEYRQIKRPLINNIRGKSAHPIEYANVIQVTSSLQGEGKTFTAINLAISLAMEMDFNILLVDADVAKSSITRTLIDQVETGLTDYLSGEVNNLSEVLLNTNIEKLKILPAGKRNQLSSELLSSQYMDNLLSEFSRRYENRIVILDSAPMLQTNESRILAQKVGQIVFVVEQGKTEKTALQKALHLISKDAVVGLVMNKSRTGKSDGYYGYYYGDPEE